MWFHIKKKTFLERARDVFHFRCIVASEKKKFSRTVGRARKSLIIKVQINCFSLLFFSTTFKVTTFINTAVPCINARAQCSYSNYVSGIITQSHPEKYTPSHKNVMTSCINKSCIRRTRKLYYAVRRTYSQNYIFYSIPRDWYRRLLAK